MFANEPSQKEKFDTVLDKTSKANLIGLAGAQQRFFFKQCLRFNLEVSSSAASEVGAGVASVWVCGG